MQIDASRYRHIVVLTGAGLSVASGLPTYRGPGGVWDEHRVEEFGHARTLRDQPQRTWQLFGALRGPVAQARPNAAHRALARFEAGLQAPQNFLLVTQNVDGLHARAGSRRLVELHGNVTRTRCANPDCALAPYEDPLAHADAVPRCPALRRRAAARHRAVR